MSARGQLRAPRAAEAFTILLFLDGPLTSRGRASQVSGRSAGGQGSLPYFAGRLLWCCAHCRLSFLYRERPIPRTKTPVSACGSRTSNPWVPFPTGAKTTLRSRLRSATFKSCSGRLGASEAEDVGLAKVLIAPHLAGDGHRAWPSRNATICLRTRRTRGPARPFSATVRTSRNACRHQHSKRQSKSLRTRLSGS